MLCRRVSLNVLVYRNTIGDAHLRVKEAGRGLNDGGGSVVSLELVDIAVGVGDNSNKLEKDILGLHVEGEGERKLLLLTSLNGEVVRDSSQVTDDALVGGLVSGKLLGGSELATNEGDLDGSLVAVLDLNNSLGRSAIDKLDAKDVGVGERRSHVGSELGSVDRGSVGIGGVLV